MKMRNLGLVMVMAALFAPLASAKSQYLTAARLKYPNIVGTQLDSCSLCHSSGTNRNPYGSDYQSHSHNFTTIESLDSDNDGFSNINEINSLTFPGNSTSFPVVMPSIKVRKPNGGETFTIGTKIAVVWKSTGDTGTDVTIELWRNGQKVKTLKGSTPNDGKQRVLLKDTLPTGTGFKIRVKSISDPSIFDDSDASFTIDPAVP